MFSASRPQKNWRLTTVYDGISGYEQTVVTYAPHRLLWLWIVILNETLHQRQNKEKALEATLHILTTYWQPLQVWFKRLTISICLLLLKLNFFMNFIILQLPCTDPKSSFIVWWCNRLVVGHFNLLSLKMYNNITNYYIVVLIAVIDSPSPLPHTHSLHFL